MRKKILLIFLFINSTICNAQFLDQYQFRCSYFSKDQDSIDLSDYIIEKLPSEFIKFQKLQFLNMENTSLIGNEKILKQLSKLQSIYVKVSSFSEIPQSLASKIKGITYTGKSIDDIKKIGRFENLEFLEFANYSNRIVYFHLSKLPEAFFQLSNLQTVDFCSIRIDSIQGDFSKLRSLRTLAFTLDSTTFLSPRIRELENLKSLKMDVKNRQIPQEIYAFKNLESLTFWGHNINRISEHIALLKNLKSLELASGSLNEIPEPILQLSQLERLSFNVDSISGNSLTPGIKRLKALKVLELRGKIKYLPKEIGSLKNIEYLDVSANLIASLPEDIGSLNNLKELYCQDNKLSQFPASLVRLNELVELSAGSNHLKILPDHFERLTNLRVLSLNDNKNIDMNNCRGLSGLTAINIGNTGVTKIPDWIFNNKNLNWLLISNNPIVVLDNRLEHINRLKYIYAKECKIENVEVDFSKLPDLKLLNIGDNQNINFPILYSSLSDVRKPVHIKYVEGDGEDPLALTLFYDSQTDPLVREIGRVKNLEYFDAARGDNAIIPFEIGNNRKLKVFSIYARAIKNIPVELTSLRSLRELCIGSGQLSFLPKRFSNLDSLETLILYGNRFTKFPPSIRRLRALKWLSLNENSLKSISGIGHLKSLQRLSLSKNQLTGINKKLYRLKNLSTLDLQDNQIRNISESIANLQQLEWLDLHNNEIKNIPASLSRLKKLRYLNLIGIPINDEEKRTLINELPKTTIDLGPKGTIIIRE